MHRNKLMHRKNLIHRKKIPNLSVQKQVKNREQRRRGQPQVLARRRTKSKNFLRKVN
jgi:hypothetical protein